MDSRGNELQLLHSKKYLCQDSGKREFSTPEEKKKALDWIHKEALQSVETFKSETNVCQEW